MNVFDALATTESCEGPSLTILTMNGNDIAYQTETLTDYVYFVKYETETI